MDNNKKLSNFASEIKGRFIFNYDLKKTNWFNIGGKAKVYFKPESLNELASFLKKFGNQEKIFLLGAGSNILINDGLLNGVVIKLGKNFSNISLMPNKTIVAGSAVLDKKLSEFAANHGIGGLEFLSCIPGTVGGGLRMNSGCFKREFKDIVLSVQAIDKTGKIVTIPSSEIQFEYRATNLGKEMIFLSASLRGYEETKEKILQKIKFLQTKKNESQPTKVKTGGSTFKNPINQTDQKVWELIKKSVPSDIMFGDAHISQKHSNFFVNKKDASFEDMKKLIDFVKNNVKLKTGVDLETEIEIIMLK